jgi:copper resistance protein C
MPTQALAHDELVDQTPRPGETVAAGVISIELTFSNELLVLGDGSGSEIIILNENGAPMNNGCAVVEGNLAIAKADIDAPGSYRVGWRAVSSDGHPISGEFEFVVVNETGYVADPDYIFTTCENPVDSLISTQDTENPVFIYWILWGSLGLGALALVLFLRPGRGLGNGKKRED